MQCQLHMIDLEIINTGVVSCRRCDLRGEDDPVPGAGYAISGVVVVGEAPRGDDGLLGRPFEDRAGLNLKKLMRMAGLKHEECWLTFAVKCKGTPAMEWRSTKGPCRTWLWQELQELKPKVVVTLGWNPTRLLLKPGSKAKLEDTVGKSVPLSFLGGAIATPWYSPAVILRHGRDVEKRTVEFFKVVREIACSDS